MLSGLLRKQNIALKGFTDEGKRYLFFQEISKFLKRFQKRFKKKLKRNQDWLRPNFNK